MSVYQANAILLFTGVIWGLAFVAQETAMEDIGPLLFVGLRFSIAALATLPFVLIQGPWYRQIKASTIKDKLTLVGVGCIFFLGMALQQVGLIYTNVTKAGFLTGLYLLLVPFILRFIFLKKQHWLVWPCALLALSGIYLINKSPFDKLNIGDYLIIGCSLFWALHIIYIGKLVHIFESSILIACIQFSICGALGLISYFVFSPFFSFEAVVGYEELIQAVPELLYTALVAGALAFSLQIVGQRHTSETSAAILLSSEALFAALFATILLGENMSIQGYTGCLLLFLAMLTVQVLPNRFAKD